ncbi:MAG: hypothetical protein IOD05_05300 [Rhodobacter sp.]|nr:hypothetical protein [Rhodobacter sp.]MCA3492811.1 hypothetical protein [Rhodobacter sp.]MCA3501566.1 hypothetical protein [Rhodobacter sp.]MCA3502662.1 hypothetical protein [Rhodobacter sp.]MCA3518425.1 hypothetical protein [Rhodobacter sp.]
MSRWTEQFLASPVHQNLKQLNDWLAADGLYIDAEHEIEKRRLRKTLQVTAEVLEKLDPEFYPEQLLAQLDQQISQPPIWNNLQAYFTLPNTQNLRDANEGMTAVAQTVTQISALSQPRESRAILKSLEAEVDTFYTKIKDYLAKLESEVAKCAMVVQQLELQQVALTESQSALRQSIEKSSSVWQTNYTDAQMKRAEDFSNAQIERSTKFDDALREWTSRSDTEVKELSAAHTSKLLKAFEEYQSDVDGMVLDMKAKHEAILSIHGLVGTDGVAGGYQRSSTDEQNSANRWRRISMYALTLAAAWIFLKYWLGFELTQAGATNWAEVATAISLTVVLVGAAGYAARQSKMHREAEQQMRWFALEVKAIDPFLSSLPKEEQNILKNLLVQKLFGKDRLSVDRSEGTVDLAAFKRITDTVVSVIKAMGKA